MSRRSANWRAHAHVRRGLGLGLVLAQTLFATDYAMWLLPYHGGQPLEVATAIVFGFLFAWVSAGFWTGMFGLWDRMRGGDPVHLAAWDDPAELAATPLAKTAVLVPIYHEDVPRVAAGIEAIYRSVAATGQLAEFEFFILSDSRDPEIWLREQEAWQRLCRRLGARGRLHYRRRGLNLNRKSGNVADFLRRWGALFHYMVVLDADSLMDGETLVSMVQTMERHGEVALLQTAPRVVDGQTFYARIQQFANRMYGPLFLRGLARTQMGDATFWGHNAILRIAPFVRHCALPKIRGWGPLTGGVLSHDFVEAALLGRAGHEIWIMPKLAGSYEETPPSLVDDLKRDRRWAEGNLQHLRLMFLPGLRFVHRLSFGKGVMSYLSSPLWLLFLVLGTIEYAQIRHGNVNYFPEPYSPYPVWPEWHPESALLLLLSTLFLLFAPKVLSALLVLVDGKERRGFGGFWSVVGGILLESVMSVFLAPLRMFSHSVSVLGALLGWKVNWAGQRRDDGRTTWSEAWYQHGAGTIMAVTWIGVSLWIGGAFVIWTLPVSVPLLLGPAISVMLSDAKLGAWLRGHRLLLTPEEVDPPEVLRSVQESDWLAGADQTPPGKAFEQAIVDPRRNRLHAALARRRRHPPATAAWMAELRLRCLDQGPNALSRQERASLANDHYSLTQLHRMVWQRGSEDHWDLGPYPTSAD